MTDLTKLVERHRTEIVEALAYRVYREIDSTTNIYLSDKFLSRLMEFFDDELKVQL